MSFSPDRLRGLEISLLRSYPRLKGAGLHEGRHAGAGLMPLPSREWQPGDTLRQVDWIRTIQFGKTMIKQRVLEFDARVTVIVDLEERIDWGGPDALELMSDIMRFTAEALTQLLVWNGDSIGHIVAGSDIRISEPVRGDGAIGGLRRLLNSATTVGEGQFVRALRSFNRMDQPRELVIVLSDFLAEGWEREIRIMAEHHDVVAFHLLDPSDVELPDIGTIVVQDGMATRRVKTGSVKTRQKYHSAALTQQRAIQSTMRAAEVRHIVLDTSQPLIQQLASGISRQSN